MKDILKQAEEKMQKSIHVLSDEFAAVRAGRANPAILDKVMVDYYGAPTAINKLAAVSVDVYKRQNKTLCCCRQNQPWYL